MLDSFKVIFAESHGEHFGFTFHEYPPSVVMGLRGYGGSAPDKLFGWAVAEAAVHTNNMLAYPFRVVLLLRSFTSFCSFWLISLEDCAKMLL
jgi:hypothetical protein